MSKKTGKQLVPVRPRGTLQTTSGATRVVSTAVSDALNIARSKTRKLTEIGGFQFNEESCKQLEIWAKEIIFDGKSGVELEFLVGVLADKSNWKKMLIDGKLYFVSFSGITKWANKRIDLSHTPDLTVLDCGNNQLTGLDLSHTPGLEKLSWGTPEELLIRAVFGEDPTDIAIEKGLTLGRSRSEYAALGETTTRVLVSLTPREARSHLPH